jgi:adenylate cyclase
MAGSRHVGWFYVGASRARIKQETDRALTINAGVFIAALLLLFVYSAIALGRMVTRPLGRVMDAMHAVQEGRFDEELRIDRNDEMGVLADTYNIMVRGLAEREKLKDAFSRYVSTQVYERLKLGEINLEGETRNATVLFSDIRSFTALSERLSPHDVVALLNDYFNVMVEIVFKHEGFLNKFIGDALMAVYNAPLDQTQPELRAVRTALEMIEALDRFNQERAKRGQFAVKIGIGINTGPVTAGNIGHVRRLEYTVIGDTVNLAQRVESQTKVTGMPVLISQSTYDAVAAHVVAQPLPPVKVKGKQEPVALYAVSGLQTGGVPPIAAPTVIPPSE